MWRIAVDVRSPRRDRSARHVELSSAKFWGCQRP
jgi:hypothetical protein